MTDRAVRLRLDVDIRGDDVGLGALRSGPPGPPVRDGELAEPIREVTIASTVQRLLQEVTGIGDDLQWLPMSSAGVSLVVGDVTMSGA